MQYPDWLMKAKESKKLLQWIQDPVHSFKMFRGRLLLKCQEEDCIVFYAVDSNNEMREAAKIIMDYEDHKKIAA